MPIITDSHQIFAFLVGAKPDAYGRMFEDTLGWTDEQLEQCHSQIQWVFPLHEESNHAETYPVLTPETVALIKGNLPIYTNMLKAKTRMEKFLGIGEYLTPWRLGQWFEARNHNLLRITRIIRSLRLLGMQTQAQDFYEKVTMLGTSYGVMPGEEKYMTTTLRFWAQAMGDDVWNTLLTLNSTFNNIEVNLCDRGD